MDSALYVLFKERETAMVLEISLAFDSVSDPIEVATVKWSKSIKDLPKYLKTLSGWGGVYEIAEITMIGVFTGKARYLYNLPSPKPVGLVNNETTADMSIFTTSKKDCECGAFYTSFPDLHMRYCPLHREIK